MYTITRGDRHTDDHATDRSAAPCTVTPLGDRAGGREEPGSTTLEALAHAVLRVIGDHPGQLGRLRAARVASSRAVAGMDEVQGARLARYGVSSDLPLRSVVELVDAMVDGGLLHRTSGPRPVLVLTRAGHHALDALEATGQ